MSGRFINITTDLKALADPDLLHTFYYSPIGNMCFHGKCSYYCDSSHAICGNPDNLEASLAAFLPSKTLAPRKKVRNPWRQSYNKHKNAEWFGHPDYCEYVKTIKPYHKGRRLLDIMDMAILDFLMGNLDRHHYEIFKNFGDQSYIIHLDHGRGFGKPHFDEVEKILAPLSQCCMIRATTLWQLLYFYDGKNMTLGEALKKSLKDDPVDPVLLDPHFEAIDRRVEIILKTVDECLNMKQSNEVVFSLDQEYDSGYDGEADEKDEAFLNENGH